MTPAAYPRRMKVGIALICVLMPIIAVAGDTVPLRLARNYPIVEGVYINGGGPYRFLLDTGAQTSAVRADVAERLRLRPAYRIEMATHAGSHDMVATIADRVSLGGQSVEQVELAVHELAGIRCVDRAVQGVLGQNFLSKFNYLLDYRNRRLVFDDEEAKGERIPFERVDGRPAIRAVSGGKLWRLVLDSGASDLIFFADAGEWGATSGKARLVATGSQRDVRMTWLPEMRVGAEVMRNIAVGVGPRDSARAEDGLLPTALFRGVYFDNREGFVVLNGTLKCAGTAR
jgi:hypothetical protein